MITIQNFAEENNLKINPITFKGWGRKFKGYALMQENKEVYTIEYRNSEVLLKDNINAIIFYGKNIKEVFKKFKA